MSTCPISWDEELCHRNCSMVSSFRFFFSSTFSVPPTCNLQVASEYSSRSSPKELLQEFPSEACCLLPFRAGRDFHLEGPVRTSSDNFVTFVTLLWIWNRLKKYRKHKASWEDGDVFYLKMVMFQPAAGTTEQPGRRGRSFWRDGGGRGKFTATVLGVNLNFGMRKRDGNYLAWNILEYDKYLSYIYSIYTLLHWTINYYYWFSIKESCIFIPILSKMIEFGRAYSVVSQLWEVSSSWIRSPPSKKIDTL